VPQALSADMRRLRARRRLVCATVALLAVSAGAATVLSPDGSDEQRSKARAPVASPQTPTPPHQRSPAPSRPLPATASPVPAAVRARAHELLIGYLAQLHGRGSVAALRHLAAGGLARELRRNRPRVTPTQERTRSGIVELRAALRSPGSVRAVATVNEGGGPPFALQLYLERRGARWVVTRIGDA
jgi:hypothetical protein